MASHPDRWLAHTDAVLREAGLRTSPGRAAVTEILARGDCLMTAQDILLRSRRETTRAASIATVYRTLDLLHEHGLVRRVDAGEGIARYERLDPSGDDAHHHVVFDDGTVEPFSDAELTRAMAGLGQRLGLEIDACELIVHARRR
jgi:Fur family transcriptional regulator, ferric uptake regulator